MPAAAITPSSIVCALALVSLLRPCAAALFGGSGQSVLVNVVGTPGAATVTPGTALPVTVVEYYVDDLPSGQLGAVLATLPISQCFLPAAGIGGINHTYSAEGTPTRSLDNEVYLFPCYSANNSLGFVDMTMPKLVAYIGNATVLSNAQIQYATFNAYMGDCPAGDARCTQWNGLRNAVALKYFGSPVFTYVMGGGAYTGVYAGGAPSASAGAAAQGTTGVQRLGATATTTCIYGCQPAAIFGPVDPTFVVGTAGGGGDQWGFTFGGAMDLYLSYDFDQPNGEDFSRTTAGVPIIGVGMDFTNVTTGATALIQVFGAAIQTPTLHSKGITLGLDLLGSSSGGSVVVVGNTSQPMFVWASVADPLESYKTVWVSIEMPGARGTLAAYHFYARAPFTYTWTIDAAQPIYGLCAGIDAQNPRIGYVFATTDTALWRFNTGDQTTPANVYPPNLIKIATAAAGTTYRGCALPPNISLATPSMTPTLSGTPTTTPTATMTAQPTSSQTSTISGTSTSGPTSTASRTATVSSTMTTTPTSTITALATSTSTITTTGTASSTVTASNTVTNTVSSSATATPTQTPTQTVIVPLLCATSVVALRLDNGATFLPGVLSPLHWDELFTTCGGGMRQTIAVSAAGASRCTLAAGTGTWNFDHDGFPGRSENTLVTHTICYNQPAGSNVTLTADPGKIIATLAWTGGVTFSSPIFNLDIGMSPNSGNYGIRQVATFDGSAYWVAGEGAQGSYGFAYVPSLSAPSPVVQISGASGQPGFADARALVTFNGVLYGVDSVQDAGWGGVFTFGTALPFISSPATLLTGFSGTASLWTIVFQNSSIIWAATDALAGGLGGVVCFSQVTTSWVQVNSLVISNSSIYSITGRFESGAFVLYAATNTSVYRWDTTNRVGGPCSVYTAPQSSTIRGVALPPCQPSGSPTQSPTSSR